MTNDEQRINYLVLGPDRPDGALTPDDQAELDELNALLGDPSLWDEPSPDLGDRVVAAIEADRAATTPVSLPESAMRPRNTSAHAEATDRSDNVIAIGRPSSRSGPRWLQPFVAGVAVAAAVTLGVVALNRRTDDGPATVLALAGTELAPAGVSGTARITETESGLRIELNATGLPRREGRQFYQAWLKGEAGLVPIGTFHTGDDVVLWAGVSLADFPTLTVTLEEVGEEIGEQESSGQKVLVGKVAGG